MVYEGFRLRSTEVDRGLPNLRKYLGHFLDVLMDLEARTLPKLLLNVGWFMKGLG